MSQAPISAFSGALPWLFSAATLKELWSPDAAGGDYRDEMAVATYVVQIASHVARELQGELCKAEAIRSGGHDAVVYATRQKNN